MSTKDGTVLQWRGTNGIQHSGGYQNGQTPNTLGNTNTATMRSCNGGGHNGSLLCSSGGSEDSGGSDAAPGSDKLEGPGAVTDDPIHLQRRVGLVSGVALIVGTMIGKFNLSLYILIKSRTMLKLSIFLLGVE